MVNKKVISMESEIISVLEQAGRPLSIKEIADIIVSRKRKEFFGKTPNKTVYSIIYRKNKRKKEQGYEPLFNKAEEDEQVKYFLKK